MDLRGWRRAPAAAVSGFTYQWSGPGLSSNVTSRCVSASGLASGAYEFLLIRSRDGYEVDRCVHVVNVGGSTGGTTSCRISGPTSIASGASATLCSPNDGIHSYRWSGPDRSEEHTSELQSQSNLVCRLLLEKKKK